MIHCHNSISIDGARRRAMTHSINAIDALSSSRRLTVAVTHVARSTTM
jgi:hypothetical protein